MSAYDVYQGTRPVAEAHRFDEAALAAYMAQHVEGFRGPLEVEQFKGGQSNPTYRLRAASGEYVMRRKPARGQAAALGARRRSRVSRDHARSARHRRAGAAHVLRCARTSRVIGRAFYVMELRAGPRAVGPGAARHGARRARARSTTR